jgi:hypothetical protein
MWPLYDNYFRAKHFRETALGGICNSSKVIFEQLTFEQLISSNSSSSNCIRAIYLESLKKPLKKRSNEIITQYLTASTMM